MSVASEAMMQKTRVAAYGLIVDGERILLCRVAEAPGIQLAFTPP